MDIIWILQHIHVNFVVKVVFLAQDLVKLNVKYVQMDILNYMVLAPNVMKHVRHAFQQTNIIIVDHVILDFTFQVMMLV